MEEEAEEFEKEDKKDE
jgi:hypothetical protein